MEEAEKELFESKAQNCASRNLRCFVAVAVALISFVLFITAYLYYIFFVPTSSFPVGATVEISEGTTLSEAVEIFENHKIVRSAFLLRVYMHFFQSGRPIIAGFYLFPEAEPLYRIAKRITDGEFLIEKKSVLITEGQDVFDIAKSFHSAIPTFSADEFVSLAKNDEGYLFPDTYFFFTTVTPEEARDIMRKNFDEKIKPIQEKITASGHSLSEIVTMASIIEREAVTPEDRRIISGILWKRIKIGMPLQVDAAFDYVNGKTTPTLTLDDLKIDSPYNTYEYKGLTPGPICSPGLDTIISAAEPKDSPYLYYLSDKDGKMHYARTFDEHKVNKVKYLR